jgi:hypothetical protein
MMSTLFDVNFNDNVFSPEPVNVLVISTCRVCDIIRWRSCCGENRNTHLLFWDSYRLFNSSKFSSIVRCCGLVIVRVRPK